MNRWASVALIALLSCQAVAAPPINTSEDSVYVYKTAFSWLRLYDEIRVDKSKNHFSVFKDDGHGKSGEVEEIGEYYREDISNGLAVTMPRRLSVPLDLKDGMKWSFEDRQCDADLKSGMYYILCFRGTPRLTIESETSLYIYSKDRGITAFSAQCAVNTKCWFELSSAKGMLSDLHR